MLAVGNPNSNDLGKALDVLYDSKLSKWQSEFQCQCFIGQAGDLCVGSGVK